MARQLQPLSQAGFRVQIENYSGFFTNFSGLEVTREDSKVPSGNSRVKVPVHGLIEIENVDLEKPYEDGDYQLLQLVNKSSREPLTITVQAVNDDVNETPVGSPLSLLGCVCISAKGLEVDRDSSDATMVELSFTVRSWKGA